ncbi:MAG: flagellar biosynthetic protein FlhF [Firmicutes bacterium]|nr:flagellar biosynthetic protein FlhF [Bacillota bacterium]
MRIKKYVARTLPEAMAQVKTDLGSDAVILHTAEVKVGGWFGLFSQRMIQVMAAVEQEAFTRPDPRPVPAQPARPPQPAQRPQPAQLATVGIAPPPAATATTAEANGALATQVADMKIMITELMDRVSLPPDARRLEPEFQHMLTALLSSGVLEPEAMAFVQKVRSACLKEGGGIAEAGDRARALMLKQLGTAQPVEPGRGRVVALVGPTGVGKTTTLAKLAAHLALQRQMQIALITADTYRVAAVDQLRTYADILGVPLEVVYEECELGAALERQRHRDMILVDTAGRSPHNQEHMAELNTYLQTLGADETYLVMSLTSGYRDALRVVDNYLPLGFDRFLFTKWDEAAGPGLIYNLVRKYKRPLSYITNGQSVPEDIEVADPAKITQAILGE